MFGALAAVAAVALTTDVFDDFPIIGDILGEFYHHFHACFYSLNFKQNQKYSDAIFTYFLQLGDDETTTTTVATTTIGIE